MPRRKGEFAKLVKSKTDNLWYVRRPHPENLGKIKTETFRLESKAITRRNTLNAIHETERNLLKSEHWTVGTAFDYWIERRASKLASADKEIPRANYISGVIGSVRIVDLDDAHYEKLYRHIKGDPTRGVKSERGYDVYFITLRTALNYARKKRK